MEYLWLKALHIAAVVTWIGGMLAVSMTIGAVAETDGGQESTRRSRLLGGVRHWDRRVTTPAMLLVWGVGLMLAMTGQWFPQTWLAAKLAIILLLSALHGALAGRLRRLAGGGSETPVGLLRHAPAGIMLGMATAIVLVVLKPV
ncbi:CopD family protein [Azospirillum picis]|uniref:Protoporphyrinogen IX oxidase n=1 Tax=Azospirillum picis TaxID=488438 RepID=A0ABU0MN87_9PROT|nr:CopD family protein [Azospirillum picis]MBP2301100.1 putative membrane protein [Azospirillum picis]MDQ0534938.1 putative membrane protein [Azospirillum picis]